MVRLITPKCLQKDSLTLSKTAQKTFKADPKWVKEDPGQLRGPFGAPLGVRESPLGVLGGVRDNLESQDGTKLGLRWNFQESILSPRGMEE